MFESIKASSLNFRLPDGFESVLEMAVTHPDNPMVGGALCRNVRTGVYVIICAGIVSSCPQAWARKLAGDAPAGR